MHRVSRAFLDDLLLCVERFGIDVEALVEDLDRPESGARGVSQDISWEDFVSLLERLEQRVAGPIGLERVGEWVGELRPIPILRRLAGLTAQPATLYQAGQRWALRRALPMLETEIERLPEDRLRIRCSIPMPLKTCPQLFHLGTGALRALPQSIDLPASFVHAEIEPRRGEYAILLPPSKSLRARLGRAQRAFFSSRAALQQLSDQQAELEARVYDLRIANDALRNSEERVRARAEACTDPTIEFSSDGKIVYLSPSVTHLLGHLPTAMRGTPLTEWMHPDEVVELASNLERIFKEKQAERFTVRMRHQKGSWVWVELSTSLFDDRNGTRNAVATLRYVGERFKDAQSPLASPLNPGPQAAANADSNPSTAPGADAAAQMAHALNNPLTAIIGNVQLLREENENQNGRLENVLVLARRIQNIIAGTLDLYRGGTLHRCTTSVGQLLRDVEGELSPRLDPARAAFHAGSLPRALTLCVDRAMMTTALVGIVENALEATAHDPCGLVDVRVLQDPDAGKVAFAVEDNGSGIPTKLLGRVFEARFTTKPEGTGLGLTAAAASIHAHGGTIDIKPARDRGTVVSVDLPLR